MTTKRRKRAPRRTHDDAPKPETPLSDDKTVVSAGENPAPAEPPQAGGDEVAAVTRTSSVRDAGADETATAVEPTRERTREPGPDDVAVTSERSS